MSLNTAKVIQQVNNNGVSFKNTQNVSKPVEDKTSSKASAIIGLVGLSALAATGIYIATKGKAKAKVKFSEEQEKKLAELIQSGKLDEKTSDVFRNLHGLEGESFIKKAYEEISKLMGYDKHTCPALKIADKKSSSGCNIQLITIDKSGVTSKDEQISVIRHELEHYRQKELIYRALGKDAMLEMDAAKYINVMKYNDEVCIKNLGKKYSELTEAEIENYRLSLKKKYDTPNRFNKLEKLLSQKGKISKGSPEYAEAQKIHKAEKDYIAPSYLVNEPLTEELYEKLEKTNPALYSLLEEAGEKYNNSFLELEANKRGHELAEKYKWFSHAISG